MQIETTKKKKTNKLLKNVGCWIEDQQLPLFVSECGELWKEGQGGTREARKRSLVILAPIVFVFNCPCWRKAPKCKEWKHLTVPNWMQREHFFRIMRGGSPRGMEMRFPREKNTRV